MTYSFGGYATKFDVPCSDGRTIKKSAFRKMDGMTVPLVWQHNLETPENILGNAKLELRHDGIYTRCSFNDTPRAEHASEMVKHKDINALSIHANKLIQKGMDVVHGVIREVSLVVAGANPEALIDDIAFQHGDTLDPDNGGEAIIYSSEFIELGNEAKHSEETVKMASENESTGPTVGDIYEKMTDEQKAVCQYMVQSAIEGMVEEDDTDNTNSTAKHSDSEGTEMTRNVFEGAEKNTAESAGATLTHSQIKTIIEDAENIGSLEKSVLKHAGDYGIKDIEMLFPDAKTITNTPDFIKRRTAWVQTVLSGTSHSPFSRIKSIQADITADEARAKGYTKGNRKIEEVFGLLKRETTPTTVYKKQKLDRDDIIDITSFDVVAWLKAEMRLMLEEEIARAILISDGRPVDSPDKIKETNIRPILKEDPLYAPRVSVTVPADGNKTEAMIEAALRSRTIYEGSGSPTLFVGTGFLTDMLLLKDKMGRRMYETDAAIASAMRVSNIVEVGLLDGVKTPEGEDLLGIMVNLRDYTIGADKGGQTEFFDDFDIDFNQWKYLYETRLSGALTKVRSAIIFSTPTAP